MCIRDRFNRTGEFFLSTGDDSDYAQFLYQINSDGTLSEVPGAEYDDADEGFYFNTRKMCIRDRGEAGLLDSSGSRQQVGGKRQNRKGG